LLSRSEAKMGYVMVTRSQATGFVYVDLI